MVATLWIPSGIRRVAVAAAELVKAEEERDTAGRGAGEERKKGKKDASNCRSDDARD